MNVAGLLVATALTASLVGCDEQKSVKHPSDNCHVKVGGQTLFVGEPACMRKLPRKRMSGVWALGMEYSVFYEGASQVPKEAFSDNTATTVTDVWLDADPEDILKRYGVAFDGNNHAYRIDFIGTKSDAAGVYGHFGMYRHGALVLRIISVKEIPLSR